MSRSEMDTINKAALKTLEWEFMEQTKKLAKRVRRKCSDSKKA